MGDQVRSSAASPTRAPRRKRGAFGMAAVVLASSIAVASTDSMPVRAAHPTYTSEDIVVPGAYATVATEINSAGTMMATAYYPDSSMRAVIGSAGSGYTDIGDLGGSVLPRDINEVGDVMGQASLVAGVYPDRTFFWSASGGMVDIGGLSGSATAGGFAMNDNGMVVGGSGTRAFTWTAAGGMVDIGIPGHTTYAYGVNNSGTVIIRDITVGRTYVRTADGTMTDIGSLPGGETYATDINDNGMVTGWSGQPGSGIRHPFVWTAATGIVDLDPTNAFGITFGQGTDLNDQGEVVGRLSLANGDEPAFYWSAATGMVIIDGLGTTNRETEADAINELGQVVGYSYTATNEERGFLWTLTDGILELDVRDAYDNNDAGQIVGAFVDPGTGNTGGRLFSPFVDPDGNGNGVDDAIEVVGPPLGFDDDNTYGSITAANGYDIDISDAAAPDGVRIVVSGAGTGKATFSVCGFTMKLAAGSDVVVTCGSVIVKVLAGSAEVDAAGGSVTVTVASGAQAEVDDAVDGSVVVTNLGITDDVTVLVGNTSSTVTAGATSTFSTGDTTPPAVVCSATPAFVLHQPSVSVSATVTDGESGPVASTVTAPAATNAIGTFVADVVGVDHAGNETVLPCPYTVTYQFTGFAAPINNLPTVNTAKAGQAVPVKWTITDFYGVGVSDPSSFEAVTSSSGACAVGAPFDAVETYTGNSGLQYLGGGSWQFNWKTPKSYAGLCRTLHLTLADGGDHTAAFSFK